MIKRRGVGEAMSEFVVNVNLAFCTDLRNIWSFVQEIRERAIRWTNPFR